MHLEIDPSYEYNRISLSYTAMGEILDWPESRLFARVPDVSNWSVGQQIVHISMTNSGMWRSIGKILSEREPAVENSVVAPQVIELLRGESFERYAVKAPPVVQPPDKITIDEIRKWASISHTAFRRMADIAPTLPENTFYVSHPIIGSLNARAWLRTLRIHCEHHLAIIRDVDAAP